MAGPTTAQETEVQIDAAGAMLPGNLWTPDNAGGLVIFAHGSGSSRHSPRNRQVAEALNSAGLATLLFDLLTAEEDKIDRRTRELRFDIDLLTERLTAAVDWAKQHDETSDWTVGLFGASTGAAAALKSAARRPERVAAVVSRGGRPDLAEDDLPDVKAPTLLIVGGKDLQVIEMNEEAQAAMRCECRLEIVPGASHLFEEPGKLEQVAELASDWFTQYLR